MLIAIIKFIHVTMVELTLVSFVLRGIWMFTGSEMFQLKWVKIVPHIIDTLLILSAVTLATLLSFNPLEQPWLLTKIVALLFYISLGLIAFRFGRSKWQRMIAWLLALMVLIYIALVAINKQALFFL